MSVAYAPSMEDLAVELWGAPTFTGSKEIRFGRKGAKSVKPDEGIWYDHETGEGGGFCELYKLARGRLPKPEENPYATAKPNGAKKSNGAADTSDAKARTEKKEEWEPIFPPPPDSIEQAERQFIEHPDPNVAAIHRYRDLQGNITHYNLRIETKDGKRFLPRTWGKLNGELGWHPKALRPPLLPLYGLEKLNLDDEDQVIVVCEGEKSADAAQARLEPDTAQQLNGPAPKPLIACLSWWGGAARVKGANLSPLVQHQGMMITIWPDADSAGRKAAHELLTKLVELGVPKRRLWLVQVDDLAEGHDAADEEFQDAEKPFDWWLGRCRSPQTLADYLSAGAWMEREVPRPEPLLGDLITAASSTIIYGQTGIGKTMFGLAMATAMASGAPFLHWFPARPARVLYIDGEMQASLLKQRILTSLQPEEREAAKRNLFVYSATWEDELIKRFPEIGKMPPLNTEEGLKWLINLINLLETWGDKLDAVFFDNNMSLLEGDKKEEGPWSAVLPLKQHLTRREIAQIWFDHTGHNQDHLYGSSTKMWQIDTVIRMQPPNKAKAADDKDDDIEGDDADCKGLRPFILTFDKARMRTPGNWQDFTPTLVTYEDGRWFGRERGKAKQLTTQQQQYVDALKKAIAEDPAPGATNKTTADAWRDACVFGGLIEKKDQKTGRIPESELKRFRAVKSKLLERETIVVAGDLVWLRVS